jgi:signal transduction histidine kinase/ligand-binding sensor domain-containing protein/DNA-binding NarL/FixJ family response regulator
VNRTTRSQYRRTLIAMMAFLGLTAAFAGAQSDYNFTHFGIGDGMSHSRIYALLQDRDGYLWIGTSNGLNRFDGREFRVFRHDENDRGSLPDDYVTSLIQDSSGDIWVGTDGGGIGRLDPGEARFTRYHRNAADPALRISDDSVWGLLEDSRGLIWAGTSYGGLNRINPISGEIREYRQDGGSSRGLSYDNVWPMVEDPNGDIWIGTDGGGLNRLVVDREEFIHYRSDGKDGSLQSDFIFSLYIDSDQTLWVGTAGGGLHRFDRNQGIFTAYVNDPADSESLSNNSVRAMLEDRSGNFWVGTTDGLNILDRETGSVRRMFHVADDDQSLSHSRIHSIIEDAGGILWFGTRDGLNRFIEPNFVGIELEGDPAQIPRRNDIRSIASGQEGIYIGSFAGLYLINGDAQQTLVPAGIFYALARVSEDLIYAGTQDALLEIRAAEDGWRVSRLAEVQVNDLHLDDDGTLWIASQGNGLGILDPRVPDSPRWLRSSDPSLTRIDSDIVRRIAKFDESSLLLALPDGPPQLINRSSLSFADSPWPEEIESLIQMYRSADGNWWFSTDRGGLYAYDGDRLHYLDESRGLPSNVIRGIRSDGEGSLWISSIRGLASVAGPSNSGDFRIDVFRQEDGLPGLIFNPGALAVDESGRLLFGSTEGLARRVDDPPGNGDRLTAQAFPLGIEIFEDLDSRQQRYSPGEVLELSPRNTLLYIKVTAFDYRQPGQIRYAYRFSDQPDWIEIGNHGELLLSHLNPGRYSLEFRARGPGSSVVAQTVAVALRVRPPLLLQWPMFFLYASLLGGSIALYIRLRSRNHLRIIREQEQMVALRTRELTEAKEALEEAIRRKSTFFINLAHETKTPLTFIQNYLDRYLKRHPEQADLNVVKENVDKLVRDMVNYLDAEKIQRSSDLYDHQQITDLRSLLTPKLSMLSEVAGKHQLTLSMELENHLYISADPLAADRVVNNLIDNAIKYNRPGGAVRIEVRRQGESVRFSVRDSGPGISKDQIQSLSDPFFQLSHKKRHIQGIGMGLFIVRKIAEGLGTRLDIESTPGEGSLFRIDFPAAERGALADGSGNEPPFSAAADNIASGPAYLFRQPQPDKPDDIRHGDSRKHILFVDDDRDMLQFMAESFGGQYDLSFAASAEELLAGLSAREIPDLIVSDIMMDGASGHELLNQLQESTWRAVPFIFLSARSDKAEYLKSFYEGAVDFIPKPFALEDLAARIEARLEGQERRRRMLMESVQQRIAESLAPLRTAEGLQREHQQKQQSLMTRIDLSSREQEILIRVLDGKLSKEVAAELDISVRTVEKHLSNLYRKAGVQNRVELINFFR